MLAVWLPEVGVSYLPATYGQEGHKASTTPVSFLALCLSHGRCSVYICQMINCMNECEALDKQPSLSECQFSHCKVSTESPFLQQ